MGEDNDTHHNERHYSQNNNVKALRPRTDGGFICPYIGFRHHGCMGDFACFLTPDAVRLFQYFLHVHQIKLFSNWMDISQVVLICTSIWWKCWTRPFCQSKSHVYQRSRIHGSGQDGAPTSCTLPLDIPRALWDLSQSLPDLTVSELYSNLYTVYTCMIINYNQ